MNPSLLGVVACALVAGLWLAGRRPKPLLKNTDTQEVAALNRAQNTLVWEARELLKSGEPEAISQEGGAEELWLSQSLQERVARASVPSHARQAWLRDLKRGYRAGGSQRLEAMRLARIWGRREVIPLLKQGMRDPDPRVMREAALAMEAFRGRPSSESSKAQASAPPRNVARTR